MDSCDVVSHTVPPPALYVEIQTEFLSLPRDTTGIVMDSGAGGQDHLSVMHLSEEGHLVFCVFVVRATRAGCFKQKRNNIKMYVLRVFITSGGAELIL